MKPNMELRFFAQRYGVPLWKVANEYGVSEPTIIRWLREEFTSERAEEFKQIVLKIAGTVEGR